MKLPRPILTSTLIKLPYQHLNMVRVLNFKVPLTSQKPPITAVRSDRSATWELMKQLGPCDSNRPSPPTPQEELVLAAFNKPPDSLLELPEASALPLPFTYHSTVNGDVTYLSQPRLSVSKLLTNTYCELRKYYEIYAGLPSIDSGRLREGRNYHQHLEDQTHAQVNEETLISIIDEEIEHFLEEEQALLTKNSWGRYLGEQWIEHGLVRLLFVAEKHFAREINVHGFINFYNGKLATTAEELLLAVLVNGIADIVKIDQSNANKPYRSTIARDEGLSKFIEDLRLQLEILRLNKLRLVDLSGEIPKAKEVVTKLSNEGKYYLHVRDVKTRADDLFPPYQLVMTAARDQCLYYARFFDNLSQSTEFAYASHLENARRRGVEIDEPLGVAWALRIIIAQFPVLAQDMKKLARGEPIGCDEFDEYQKAGGSTTKVEGEAQFSLSNFVTEARFREMLALFYDDSKEIMEMDILDLFQPWRYPLTIRYFAARAAQAYNIFESFEPASVCIEYHNARSLSIFGFKHYPFDLKLIEQHMDKASKFWSGQRPPKETNDLTMCRRCDFRTRCPAINKPVDTLAGDAIYKLLEM